MRVLLKILIPMFAFGFILPHSGKALPLYKVQKGSQTNYILGTIHVPMPESSIPERLKRIIRNSETVLVEFNMTPEQQRDLANDWFSNGRDPSRDNKKILSSSEWFNLSRLMTSIGQNPRNFRQLRSPEALAYVRWLFGRIETGISDRQRVDALAKRFSGLDPEKLSGLQKELAVLGEWGKLPKLPIDFQLRTEALRQGKAVVGLDDKLPARLHAERTSITDSELKRYVHFGLAALEDLPERYFDYYSGEEWMSDEGPELIRRYINWRPGDQLEFGSQPTWKPDSDDYTRFVINRHDRWRESILRHFGRGPTLLAVGEGHLNRTQKDQSNYSGKTILEWLASVGYNVTFLDDACDKSLKR